MKYFIKYGVDFAALGLLYCFVFFPKWKAQGKGRLLVKTLFYAYGSVLLYFTLMPVITSLPFLFNHPYKPMNLTPFIDVFAGRGDFFRQIALNIVMTMPFGFLFPLAQDKTASLGKTALFCFLLSLGIELLQPFFNRHSDITDLITNVVGGALGYLFYLALKPLVARVLERLT